MAMEKLPEVDPPSDRVSGQGLLAAPNLKRRRRNRVGLWKKGSAPRVFGAGGKYRRRGAARGPPGIPGAPWARPRVGRATRAPGPLVGPLCPPLDDSGSFQCADFLYIFP